MSPNKNSRRSFFWFCLILALAFFQKKAKNIIRQNQKGALLEFLFGKDQDNKSVNQGSNTTFEDRIQNLQNQINSLQEKIIELEQNQNIARERNLNLVSEAPRGPFKPAEGSEEYNISSPSKIPKFKQISANQEKAQNRTNCITLSKIPEQDRIEIIQKGFQLQSEGKISLKKYYQSTQEYSLFQSKGYSIKYESIRRTKLSQSLKE